MLAGRGESYQPEWSLENRMSHVRCSWNGPLVIKLSQCISLKYYEAFSYCQGLFVVETTNSLSRPHTRGVNYQFRWRCYTPRYLIETVLPAVLPRVCLQSSLTHFSTTVVFSFHTIHYTIAFPSICTGACSASTGFHLFSRGRHLCGITTTALHTTVICSCPDGWTNWRT